MKMKKQQALVSVIIPTKNSAEFLENCLVSITSQSYQNIEIIVVDGRSTDASIKIAKKFDCKIFQYVPEVPKGTFDAPYKRNFGVKKSVGKYVYYVDADMELTKHVIKEAVEICEGAADAVIIPEDSFGIGMWARAKNLERRCYLGDDGIEAPRFFRKTVWEALGGLDERLSGGRDDGDMYQKILENNYLVQRGKEIVLHNEGNLTFKRLMTKKFMYGKDVIKYVSKRPKAGFSTYSPFRLSFLKNWRLFLSRPVDSCVFVVMKISESIAGLAGVVYSVVKR